jgi:hypothetical protein
MTDHDSSHTAKLADVWSISQPLPAAACRLRCNVRARTGPRKLRVSWNGQWAPWARRQLSLLARRMVPGFTKSQSGCATSAKGGATPCLSFWSVSLSLFFLGSFPRTSLRKRVESSACGGSMARRSSFVALIHALLMKPTTEAVECQAIGEGMKKCPHCADQRASNCSSRRLSGASCDKFGPNVGRNVTHVFFRLPTRFDESHNRP